jgi:hypothetical protein
LRGVAELDQTDIELDAWRIERGMAVILEKGNDRKAASTDEDSNITSSVNEDGERDSKTRPLPSP